MIIPYMLFCVELEVVSLSNRLSNVRGYKEGVHTVVVSSAVVHASTLLCSDSGLDGIVRGVRETKASLCGGGCRRGRSETYKSSMSAVGVRGENARRRWGPWPSRCRTVLAQVTARETVARSPLSPIRQGPVTRPPPCRPPCKTADGALPAYDLPFTNAKLPYTRHQSTRLLTTLAFFFPASRPPADPQHPLHTPHLTHQGAQ